MAKCLNFQQVNSMHQKWRGFSQDIDIPTSKCEGVNVDFVVCLPRTHRQHYSVYVIVDKITK